MTCRRTCRESIERVVHEAVARVALRRGFEAVSCNGKGHHWNCTCPFGGKRDSPAERGRLRAPDLFVPKVPRHYTKPNDRCSFCDAPVFFRSLAHGGRAYFDSPGAPWTKHPCLDQDSSAFMGSVDQSESNWPQLMVPSVQHVLNDFIEIQGRLHGKRWIGYLNVRQLEALGVDVACLRECFVQVHESAPGSFDLALLTEEMHKYLAKASATKAEESKPRSATPRRKALRSKGKAAPLNQSDLLEDAG